MFWFDGYDFGCFWGLVAGAVRLALVEWLRYDSSSLFCMQGRLVACESCR